MTICTHRQVLDGAVMYVSRSVIEILVGKNNALGMTLGLAIFSPVKNGT